MIELHLIGYTADLRHLVFDLDEEGGDGRYRVVIDGDLFATLDDIREARAARGMDTGPYELVFLDVETGSPDDRGAAPAASEHEDDGEEEGPAADGATRVDDDVMVDWVPGAPASANGHPRGASLPPESGEADDAPLFRERRAVPREVPRGEADTVAYYLERADRDSAPAHQGPVPAPRDPAPASRRPEPALRRSEPAPPGSAPEPSRPEPAASPGGPPSDRGSREVDAPVPEAPAPLADPTPPEVAAREASRDRPPAPYRPSATQAPPESRLSPAEIQAQLRAGRSVRAVAKDAGTGVEWVERWLAPIEAERAEILERAWRLSLERPRLGRSREPLGAAVERSLDARNVDPGSVAWEVGRRKDGRWRLTVRFTHRGRARSATWTFDPELERVTPSSDVAKDLGFTRPGGESKPKGRTSRKR